MPYNDQVNRADAQPLMPEEVEREIWKNAVKRSAALALFRHRSMGRQQVRIPVLALKPTAYWVTGDTGLKQTSKVNWTNKYLDAAELAVIVPIPENVLDDADYDLWAEIRPEIEEAIGVAIDDAVFFGVNKPTVWPPAIVPAAIAAGNAVTTGGAGTDIADDINTVMKRVESDGYPVNGFLLRPQFRASLRGLRDTTKQFIFSSDWFGALSPNTDNGTSTLSEGRLFGLKAVVHEAGLSGFADGTGNAELIAGDWRQGIIGIREDIRLKMLDEAIIQDDTGAIVYNLPQQDMVALRVCMRVAFQVPNPPTRLQPNEANRYPFGVIKQA